MIRTELALHLASRLTRAAALSLGVVSLLLACTTTATAVKEDKLCNPGNYVFCRCRDREEGAKLCKEDGQSFGPCEPCESYDNPEGPLEPGDPEEPLPTPDAGTDAEPEPNATCGDGIVQRGEDCDDANTNETDGCDSKCKLAGTTPFATNACPGLDVHVWGGAHKPTLASTTVASGGRRVKTTCSGAGNTATSGYASPDRVFKVVAHKTGVMTAAVTDTSYNAFLYVAETCPSDNVEWFACTNKVDGVGSETLSFPVDDGKTYYLFVDGALPSDTDQSKLQGSFRVTFQIP